MTAVGSAPEPARMDALADPSMAIVTRGLTKRYGKRQALAGIDLDVPRGRIYGFLGPNGSGKTTTLRILVGLIRPDAGSVAVLGAPWDWHDRRRLFRIGSMIETPAFTPYLSARDNLRTYAGLSPGAKVVVSGAFDSVEIWEPGRFERMLSAGTEAIAGGES